MAWYVSLKNGKAELLAAGPYNTHGEAMRMMRPVLDAAQRTPDPRRHFYETRTCRTKSARPPAHPGVAALLGDVPPPAGLP